MTLAARFAPQQADVKKECPWVPTALRQTRRGDRGMCMRFWGENTRETEGSERLRLSARAFHPKARSHTPITTPSAV